MKSKPHDSPLERLFTQMARMRAFELALGDLWARGLISGELHLGIGEEGIVAGVVDHLTDGDALALDHRSTPPLVARGVDLEAMTLEMLGHEDGLGGGRGGHMHLLSPQHLAASSGIVGSSGPLAAGFALSARLIRPGKVSVAFFGEAAANQGMLMEAFNLAVAWNLPVVFVCKDDGWSITTRSEDVTGGTVSGRAAAFGLETRAANGSDVQEVWRHAGDLIERARHGLGPGFLHATCYRPRGHFEDFQLFRLVGSPRELLSESAGLTKGLSRPGGSSPAQRINGLNTVLRTLGAAAMHQFGRHKDPLSVASKQLPRRQAAEIQRTADTEVAHAVDAALQRAGAP